jgi:type IV secretion system protein VirB10
MMANMMSALTGGGGAANKKPVEKPTNIPAVAFPVQLARNIQVSADLSILQGSTIRCLMNTRLISDISGQVVCTVTENILSTSAKRVLIPKGTKVVGEYNGKASESLERVGIIWSRLITPNNIDIALESPGTDPLGSAGVPGYVDEKWRLRLGAAVLITLTSDILKVGVQTFAPKTTIARPDPTTGKIAYEEAPFDSATVKMLNKATEPYLNRVLNAPPTILIQQGTLVSIQTAKDMDFSDVYENK